MAVTLHTYINTFFPKLEWQLGKPRKLRIPASSGWKVCLYDGVIKARKNGFLCLKIFYLLELNFNF